MIHTRMAVVIDHPHERFKPLARLPMCRLQSYSHFDPTMHDFTQNITHITTTFHKSYSTPCLSLATKAKEEDFEPPNPRIQIICGHKAPMVHALVAEVAIALASGVKPTPVPSGLGGAYYMQSRKGSTIAVVKPADEEPLAFNNPKGFAGRMLGQPGMKRSIRVGETGLRELAAYLLDHGGFAGVPPSALAKICHVRFNVNINMGLASNPPFKITSVQRYVEHDSDAGDLGPSRFSACSVHRIGILDIRLLNLDRHAGNMLVKNFHGSYVSGMAELVPIDHGFCLPESLDDPYFEWLHWPQASMPFSEIEADYISNLDPFKDAELLRTELPLIRECSVRVFILCTIFLKRATAAGLSLADIGEMMTRGFIGGEESSSILENICVNAKANLDMDITSDGSDESKEYEEMFAFDKVFEDDLNQQNQGVPTHSANGKPSKMMKYSSAGGRIKLSDARLTRLIQESDIRDGCGPAGIPISRSVSFAAHNKNHDTGVCVSFGEMNEDEWSLFLENFEELLPEAFEQKRSTSLLKQRLGNSCEF